MSHPRGPLSQLRRGHEELVLGLLRKHGPLSRGELGKRCGLSRTTLYDILAELVAGGAVVTATSQEAPRGRGRPAETLTLNPDAGQAIGIDFARRALHVAAVNLAHEVVGSASEPHDADLPWEQRVELAVRLVGSLTGTGTGALRLGALDAIGVGVVGVVGSQHAGEEDRPAEEGGAQPGPHPVQVLLRERFGVPVLLDNNTRLAALGESIWGAAAGGQDVLYLRLSHGVGGGLVVGGSLHRGAYGLSGEFGHITVEPGGARCDCGGTGCLETVASIRAVLDAFRAAGGRAADVPELVKAVRAGDQAALTLLGGVGARIGEVLAALCNAIGPSVIVIGGELAETGEALLAPVERALHDHVMPVSRHRVSLRRATLGEVAGALGGIALVLHESPLLSRYPAGPDLAEDPIPDKESR
ncbi:Crp/Fnr family transcriptional regulator [[Actinomadura] parvosata subsp. kistnae]|uniref:Crp/Fnr family transcriptional regulator n=1 Tax=[Actinomadura] parvosata subsp. kistnae TaxID=1909395 RepID=A0A1V0A5I2_9ACTN|nr:ROK family transcriptional regulator [Nonomuraea sp. ATCC 55076]AQZ65409.1 Crp/Fnr family transcriptional regulator [Nonomuraea sp. ATCC 55076]